VSKQPQFKGGAVRIEKIPHGKDSPYIREEQSAAAEKASQKNDAASSATQDKYDNLERQMELWLGETYETIVQLFQIYEELIPRLIHHDLEVEGGLRLL
jgi:hypothetical protein